MVYGLHNQWDTLALYLTDLLVPVDNSETEQLMKQVAVQRRNWLPIGGVTSAYQMADLMTIISRAKRHDQ
jgi:hypothetical protein